MDKIIPNRSSIWCELADKLEQNKGWDALQAFFRDSLWDRLWVVPKIALAGNAVPLIGSLSVNFSVLEQAIKTTSDMERYLDEVPFRYPSSMRLLGHEGWKGTKQLLMTQAQLIKGHELPLSVLL